MRRKFAVGLVLAVVVAALVSIVPAGAYGPTAVYTEVTNQFYNVDPGNISPIPAAPFPVRNAGSTLVFTADLKNQAGSVVGSSHAICTIVTDGRSRFVPGPNPPFFGDIVPINPPQQVALAQCQQTLRLHDGDLQIAGLLDEYAFEAFQPATYAIVGGTGAYDRARGTVRITQVVYPHTAKVEVFLIPW